MRGALALSACAMLAAAVGGCELLPPAPDGGHTRVPGSYLDARRSEGHRAHLALTGDEQLSCHDCHFISDAGFSGAAVKPCAACHDKQQEHHHPFDGGVPMTCFSCHAFRAIGESAHIDKWGCASCHVKPHEGAPHVGVHTEKCESCHRPHGTPFTRAADCGQCHDVTVSHGKGEQALPADTCMSCHPHHSKAVIAAGKCTGCHLGASVPPIARVKAGALFDKGHLGCSTCHKPHQFTAAAASNCKGCHADQPVLAAEKHHACVTCHRPHEERAAPVTCESCHVKAHVQHPKDAKGRPCLGCHPVHAPQSAEKLAVPCSTCHRDAPFDGAAVHASTVTCEKCHQAPHAGKPKREGLCQSCHVDEHALVKKNPGHAKCESCHAGLPHAPPQAPKGCLECHATKVPPQAGHAQCSSCHAKHSAEVTTQCVTCHNKPDAPLPGLHAVVKHQQCQSCHAPHTPQPGFGPKTCFTCHTQLSKKSHPTTPQQCVSCHLFTGRK